MMQPMTDIHQHFLWGIDDGAATPEIMYNMLRTAHEQGIRTVVATPHAVPGLRPFDLALFRERLAEAQNFCKAETLNLRVLPGAEIAWTDQTALALRQGRIPTLGETDYVLLELWPNISWQTARNAVNQVIRAGYCPVLAHVERYRAFVMSPKAAIRFRDETGAMLQINADTLMNPRGYMGRRFCSILLNEGAVDAIATDAHDCMHRPVNLRAAHKWLTANTDEKYANKLTSFGGVFI